MPTFRTIVVLIASSSERRSARGLVRSVSVSAVTCAGAVRPGTGTVACAGVGTVTMVGAGVGVFLVVVCGIRVVALTRLTIKSRRRVMKILLVVKPKAR